MTFPLAKRQQTIRARAVLTGVGVHSGAPAQIVLNPADPDTGVVFLRTGAPGRCDVEIPARAWQLGATELCTVLGDPKGAFVATVEHLLAAFSALGVDNVLIEVDGPEVPVMDGSAQPFVAAIDSVGLQAQAAPKRYLRVLKPVRVEDGASFAEFRPFEGRRYEVAIDYDHPLIGVQRLAVDLTPARFRSDVARARTFGFMKDVERLWSAGFALGSSLENSVVIGEDGLLNPEGLRFPDEFARHKLLDAIGDLSLAGAPILGAYRSYKGGHRINALALKSLLDQTDAWTMVEAGGREVRKESWADLIPGILSPAFQPKLS